MRLNTFCFNGAGPRLCPPHPVSYSSGSSCISTKPVYNTSSVGGFRTVDRHEIINDKSVEELNAQLVNFVGENGAEMLIRAFRSRRNISGPELAG